jgi:hypothetical protein
VTNAAESLRYANVRQMMAAATWKMPEEIAAEFDRIFAKEHPMTESQADQDAALAKSMKRQPLERKLGESDFHYHRRLSRTLTEAQIALAHDMHAIHAAQAAGFELPPLPVSDEQKAADIAQAKALGVKPVERNPGELDADYDLRLSASEPVDAVAAAPVAPAAPSPIVTPGIPGTTYPAHVDAPAPQPHAFGDA